MQYKQLVNKDRASSLFCGPFKQSALRSRALLGDGYADKYGRRLDSLRLIVTQRCNFKCVFCHREGDMLNSLPELSPADFWVIARGARRLGVTSYKITGGEPLLRGDLADIVRAVRPHSLSVSLTTNGYFLAERAAELADSGLDHVNVSIPTLDERKFRDLTGGDLAKVLDGLRASVESGLKTKVNVVVLSENVGEIEGIISFASDRGLDVNLIQLMPVFYYERDPAKRVELYKRLNGDVWRIEMMLRERAEKVMLKQPHNRTVYVLPSGIEVTVIKGYGNPFACSSCTRMRVTHDGFVKTCLYDERASVSLRECLAEADEECVAQKLQEALRARVPTFKMPIQLSYTKKLELPRGEWA